MFVWSFSFMKAIVFSLEYENVLCFLNGLFLWHEKQLPILLFGWLGLTGRGTELLLFIQHIKEHAQPSINGCKYQETKQYLHTKIIIVLWIEKISVCLCGMCFCLKFIKIVPLGTHYDRFARKRCLSFASISSEISEAKLALLHGQSQGRCVSFGKFIGNKARNIKIGEFINSLLEIPVVL